LDLWLWKSIGFFLSPWWSNVPICIILKLTVQPVSCLRSRQTEDDTIFFGGHIKTTKPINICNIWKTFAIENLLLSKELRIIKLSSRYVIISDVSAPFSNNSPLDLKLEKERILPVQSLTTCASLASISFSLTAEIHTSYNFTINA
jgi:hypothetical protein